MCKSETAIIAKWPLPDIQLNCCSLAAFCFLFFAAEQKTIGDLALTLYSEEKLAVFSRSYKP